VTETRIESDVLLSLPFDHYERYALTKRIVDVARSYLKGRLTVLDVGGHYSSLKHFLPDDSVTLADPQAPPDFTYRDKIPFEYDEYVVALGGSLPFPDGSFDVVTAHDTLEHVPPEYRAAFLRDLIRVSRGIVVINGPVHNPQAAAAEVRLARFLENVRLGHNVSLEEHLTLGLPDPDEIERVLRETGREVFSLSNGNLALWLLMMGLKHYLMAIPDSEPVHEEIDRSYNKLLTSLPLGGVRYRRAYVIAADPTIAGALNDIEDAVSRDSLAERSTEPAAVARLLDNLESHAIGLKDDLQQLVQVTAEAGLLRATLARRERELASTEDALRGTTRALQETQHVLNQVTGSIGYRALEGYRGAMRFVFPPNSVRGVPYRAITRSVRAAGRGARDAGRLARRSRRVIEREGWGGFRRKAWSRLVRRTARPEGKSITYEEWIRLTEPGADEMERQRKAQQTLPCRPLISIVTPVWNPSTQLLRETIESVRSQTYDNWELCLVDGASEVPGVRDSLEEAAAGDSRIRVRYLDSNKGIVGNTNEALAMTGGDYVAFLDHTDTLAPNALWEVVSQLNRDPRTVCIYSDHDLISIAGKRYEPLFKPSWSPETMLSANFATHLCVIRSDAVRETGGLRPETEGAQDWDLILGVGRISDRIVRIPRVLYHWRADSSSTLTSGSTKDYAIAAQDRVLSEHLQALGVDATIERDPSGGPRIRWQLDRTPKVSIIICTKHNRNVLEPCLRSITRSTYPNKEVIVIDNGGRTSEHEQWYEAIRGDLDLRVLWWQAPFGWTAVNSLGAREATGDVLLFLNDDTEVVQPDWLEEMVGWINYPGIGAVGAQLLWRDGRIQHGGDVIGMNGFADHLFTGAGPADWTLFGSTRWYRNVSAVTGACLMIRRDLFEKIGGLDESFVLCGSDVELCLRVRRTGKRIVCTPFAGVLHHERATRSGYDDPNDVFASFWRYQSALFGGDPYFNPNLSLFSRIPALRHPEEPSAPVIVSPVVGRPLIPGKQGVEKMEDEATILAETCQLMPGEVEATRLLHAVNQAPFEIRSINWFIPDFESPFYGGIHTILRFADQFKQTFGVSSRFVVMGSGPEQYIRSGIAAAYPSLGDSDIFLASLDEEDLQDIPYADATVATLWITAYAVSKVQNTKRKFYMIQDFEPIFYPAGTLSALSDATYRFGLYGICNTHTLQSIYETEYGGKAYGFDPAVDTGLFRPPEGPRRKDDTMTVFLYGRPGHWRNCYELAVATIRRLKQRMKKSVRVVSAGSWVPSGDSESAYLVDNLGLLDYRETAKLYQTCDVGLTFSMSKHPSYLPLELMASGALVVTNVNPYGSWLLKDGENCLLAEPTAESLCAALEKALTDDELRASLTANAVADIQQNRSDWTSKIEGAYRFMCNPEGL